MSYAGEFQSPGRLNDLRCYSKSRSLRGRGFDTPPSALNLAQLQVAVPHLQDIVDSILATLVRHGVLAYATHTAATWGGGTPLPPVWSLTPFGRAVLDRLEMIGEALRDGGQSRPPEL